MVVGEGDGREAELEIHKDSVWSIFILILSYCFLVQRLIILCMLVDMFSFFLCRSVLNCLLFYISFHLSTIRHFERAFVSFLDLTTFYWAIIHTVKYIINWQPWFVSRICRHICRLRTLYFFSSVTCRTVPYSPFFENMAFDRNYFRPPSLIPAIIIIILMMLMFVSIFYFSVGFINRQWQTHILLYQGDWPLHPTFVLSGLYM